MGSVPHWCIPPNNLLLDSCPCISLHQCRKAIHLGAIGAVLYQEYLEEWRPVVFASRKSSQFEKCYLIHQLEFLLLKWAVVDKFYDYLYGACVTLRMDNNPLTYMLTTAKRNAVGHHRCCHLYTWLSRNFPDDKNSTEWETIQQAKIKSIYQHNSVSESSDCPLRYIDEFGPSFACVPDVYSACMELKSLEDLGKPQVVCA